MIRLIKTTLPIPFEPYDNGNVAKWRALLDCGHEALIVGKARQPKAGERCRCVVCEAEAIDDAAE